MEILKQDQYQPLPVEKQVLIIFAASNKYLDDLPVDQCRRFEKELYPFIETNYNGLLKSLREKKAFDDAIKAEAKKALDEFKEQFKATLKDEQERAKEKQEAHEKDEADKKDQGSAHAEKAEAKDSAAPAASADSSQPSPEKSPAH